MLLRKYEKQATWKRATRERLLADVFVTSTVHLSLFLSPFVPSSFIKVYNLYSYTNILGDLGGYDHKLSIKVLTIPVMYLN